jgi:hypothetical protein
LAVGGMKIWVWVWALVVGVKGFRVWVLRFRV